MEPPLNPLDVWVWEVMALHGLLGRALSPAVVEARERDKGTSLTPAKFDGEFRAALVLLRERSLGAASRWAPYLAHLPASYDLLSCWTDAQLRELRCAELEARARAQREANERRVRAAEAAKSFVL